MSEAVELIDTFSISCSQAAERWLLDSLQENTNNPFI
jgi:hypothetical protein